MSKCSHRVNFSRQSRSFSERLLVLFQHHLPSPNKSAMAQAAAPAEERACDVSGRFKARKRVSRPPSSLLLMIGALGTIIKCFNALQEKQTLSSFRGGWALQCDCVSAAGFWGLITSEMSWNIIHWCIRRNRFSKGLWLEGRVLMWQVSSRYTDWKWTL